jgi:hypothetical protein
LPGLRFAVANVPFALVAPLKAALPPASDTVTLMGGTPPYAMLATRRARDNRVPRIMFFMGGEYH